MVSLLLYVLAALLLAGIIYQRLGVARDDRAIRPPGRIVETIGGCFHVNVQGSGGPVVVLESGISASAVSWARVQPEIAAFSTVVSYDRAGLGWSRRIRAPRTPFVLAAELDRVLAAAGLPGPYVLVGHSFGGLIVRAFATRNPSHVAGMLLLDALHPAEWLQPTPNQRRMLQGGVFFSRLGAVLAAIGVVRLCLDLLARGQTRAPRAVLRSFGSGAAATVQRVLGEVTKLPPEVLPQVRAHWSRPRSFLTMASYIGSLPQSSWEIQAGPPLPPVPLIVLSAAQRHPRRVAEQADLANLCSGAEHEVLPDCGHWVHLDAPQAVVAAVRRLVERARATSSPR